MILNKIDIRNAASTRPFFFRNSSRGDTGVIQQIFKNLDYDVSSWPQGKALRRYYDEISNQQPLIIDAGANIGAASIYFQLIYEKSKIFAIEPEKNNFEILQKNVAGLNITAFNGALANYTGKIDLFNPNRSDWGFSTFSENICKPHTKQLKSSVNCICTKDIFNSIGHSSATPFIYKIDIEGGEDLLFKSDVNLIYQFPLIIIELHDWMLPFTGSSSSFLKSLTNQDVDFIYKGENIFLFNREILKRYTR